MYTHKNQKHLLHESNPERDGLNLSREASAVGEDPRWTSRQRLAVW